MLVNKEPRVAKNYVHEIELKGKDTLKERIREKCATRYVTPMVVIRKTSGEIRLCL